MENPAIEGRQVPLNSATKKQLREFAEHLGISTTNFNTPEQLVQKASPRRIGQRPEHLVHGPDNR